MVWQAQHEGNQRDDGAPVLAPQRLREPARCGRFARRQPLHRMAGTLGQEIVGRGPRPRPRRLHRHTISPGAVVVAPTRARARRLHALEGFEQRDLARGGFVHRGVGSARAGLPNTRAQIAPESKLVIQNSMSAARRAVPALMRCCGRNGYAREAEEYIRGRSSGSKRVMGCASDELPVWSPQREFVRDKRPPRAVIQTGQRDRSGRASAHS